uniref:Amine oxidase domain-containing protein n=1 Tax=Cyprinodon variegatus TaxID=28743 RepID=A0A3Q2GD46_CYPVA
MCSTPQQFLRLEDENVFPLGFRVDRVPPNLDAVVIGSGIGGLTAAALLAKAGKRVLVLEQHDHAGGCTHTFQKEGFEFDVGIHYLGQLHENSLLKVAVDQITEGQLQFVKLEQHYDTVLFGEPGQCRCAAPFKGKVRLNLKHILENLQNLKAVVHASRRAPLLAILKMLPYPLVNFLIWTGLLDKISSIFQLATTRHSEMMSRLTQNKDLQALSAYLFYGVPPKESSFLINALLLHHYKRGAYYPYGGSSEIAFHIVPVIQQAGGEVLVRSPVQRILINSEGKACGKQEREDLCLSFRKPLCFLKLLPADVQTAFTSFLFGFFGLNLKIQFGIHLQEELSVVYFPVGGRHHGGSMEEYCSLKREQVLGNIPMMFITFPSAKDPSSTIRQPGKSCMTLLTMARYEWFEDWEKTKVGKRGQEYQDMKESMAKELLEWALTIFPQLRDKVGQYLVLHFWSILSRINCCNLLTFCYSCLLSFALHRCDCSSTTLRCCFTTRHCKTVGLY